MQSETLTRVLLVSILLCLAVLIFQNFTDGSGAAAPAPVTSRPPADPDPAEAVRFRNQHGRYLTSADLVALRDSVVNEALPSDMRVWAALELQGVHNPEVSEVLISVLEDEDAVLSTAALQALAGVRDPRVREAALRALQHEDEDVRMVAEFVLKSIEGG